MGLDVGPFALAFRPKLAQNWPRKPGPGPGSTIKQPKSVCDLPERPDQTFEDPKFGSRPEKQDKDPKMNLNFWKAKPEEQKNQNLDPMLDPAFGAPVAPLFGSLRTLVWLSDSDMGDLRWMGR